MNRLTRAMITAAALAGRYRVEARLDDADRWSAVAASLAGDLVEAAACQTRKAQPPPFPDQDARHGRS